MTLDEKKKNSIVNYRLQKAIVSKEQNKLFGKLLELRQSGDYSDTVVVKEKNIKPLFEPAENFIAEIEKLINKTP